MCPRPANPHARKALLDAARSEFALRGLAVTRLEDITRRAGLSKGAFYLHFRSKEDAYHRILEEFFAVLEDLARRHQAAESDFARIHGRLTAHDILQGNERYRRSLEFACEADTELLETLWRHRRMLAILDSERGGRFAPLLSRMRRRMIERVVSGELGEESVSCLRHDIDRAVLGDLVVGAYESFARRMLHMQRKPDLRAWARSLSTVFYQGAVDRRSRRPKPP